MREGPLIRTALYDEHVALDGNIVDFHGFELPIWYSNIKSEHIATRESSGLFDVSHMGTFRFTGQHVRQWLEGVATQKVTEIPVGRCAYTHFLDHDGYIIDDMIFAVVSDTEILGVPNASMIGIMWDWFQKCSPEKFGVTIENLSPDVSIVALQGPQSKEQLDIAFGEGQHVGRFKWSSLSENKLGVEGWIQGTGYTGEPDMRYLYPRIWGRRFGVLLLLLERHRLVSVPEIHCVWKKATSSPEWIFYGRDLMMDHTPSLPEIHGKQTSLSVLILDMNSSDVIVSSITLIPMSAGGESSILSAGRCRDLARTFCQWMAPKLVN